MGRRVMLEPDEYMIHQAQKQYANTGKIPSTRSFAHIANHLDVKLYFGNWTNFQNACNFSEVKVKVRNK